MRSEKKILICGILPPPSFGHSAMYRILMDSSFPKVYDIRFLNMHFWSYQKHKKVTVDKLLKMVKYFFQYVWLLLWFRPRYVLYNMSFDKMPFLKDVLFCAVGRMFGCRVILHDMGQYARELYDSSGRLYRWLVRWLCRHAAASIVLGEKAKQAYQGLMEPQRLFSVPGSVEDTASLPTPASKRQDPQTVTILYFSFMTGSKGIFTAFNAVPGVLDRFPQARFVFAGPMQSEDVRGAFEELKQRYDSRIHHLGYVEGVSQRTEVYRQADIFIFPTHRDVFGLVLLHALAEGIPVVASVEGCIPEIVEDGKNGFLLEKGNHRILVEKILLLAGDTSLRAQIGKTNREKYLQYYVPQKYGERMIEAFKRIGELG